MIPTKRSREEAAKIARGTRGGFTPALWSAALVFMVLISGCARQKSTTTSETRTPPAGSSARTDTGLTSRATPPAGPDSLITIHTEKGDLRAYVARPSGPGPYPGIVVVHEWWGLNPQIRGVADRLAREGYVAIVPDLYHGHVTDDPEKAHELLRGLSDNAAVSELRAAAEQLHSYPEVGPKPVGIVGFCMGGGLALLTSMSGEPISACAMFYGTPVTDRARLQKLSCPVLAMFGAEDEGIPADSVRTFEQSLKDAGRKAEVKTYEKAGHAFMNETRPGYRPEAAADAWSRLQKFLSENLKK